MFCFSVLGHTHNKTGHNGNFSLKSLSDYQTTTSWWPPWPVETTTTERPSNIQTTTDDGKAPPPSPSTTTATTTITQTTTTMTPSKPTTTDTWPPWQPNIPPPRRWPYRLPSLLSIDFERMGYIVSEIFATVITGDTPSERTVQQLNQYLDTLSEPDPLGNCPLNMAQESSSPNGGPANGKRPQPGMMPQEEEGPREDRPSRCQQIRSLMSMIVHIMKGVQCR